MDRGQQEVVGVYVWEGKWSVVSSCKVPVLNSAVSTVRMLGR